MIKKMMNEEKKFLIMLKEDNMFEYIIFFGIKGLFF